MSRELHIDKEAFLAQYWQRKPLLIRGAIKDFELPFSADELAGMAMEDGIEARIIEQRDDNWSLCHGPFDEEDYRRSTPWTLLVQAVDHYIPEVAELRRLVDFIPQWRVDDVMVSYAVDGGSVGPHYDNYDVFLLQGEGQRLWKLGQFCDGDSVLLPHDDLRILRDFEQQQEFLLNPGDILYVPPGVAHWGIAQGECTTFSIGFRAPRMNEIVSRFADALLDRLEPDLFYSDSNLEGAVRAGEIRPRDLERVAAQLQAALDQSAANHWFGELVTEPRYEQFPDEAELAASLAALEQPGIAVELNPGAKLAWQHEADSLVVFANGISRQLSDDLLPLQERLCAHWRLSEEETARAMGSESGQEWLQFLAATGCIEIL